MIRKDTLTSDERALIRRARDKAFILYEGKRVPHHSCGIALAETFNVATAPYQALRRGGITGEGECGAVKAGELVLGQYLGDPDPTGPVTEILRDAIGEYQALWKERVDRGGSPDIICNHLTGRFESFHSEERLAYCTNIASTVAEMVAEVLLRYGATFVITPVPGLGEGEALAAG